MALFYSIHMYNLKHGVRRHEFEQFMEEQYIPYVLSKEGCKGAELLKGYIGEWMKQRMEYATIEIWESAAANRKAWGGPMSEWVVPQDLQPYMDRFVDYCQPETFRTLEFELVQ